MSSSNKQFAIKVLGGRDLLMQLVPASFIADVRQKRRSELARVGDLSEAGNVQYSRAVMVLS